MSCCDSCFNRVHNQDECKECAVTNGVKIPSRYVESKEVRQEMISIKDSGSRTEYVTGAVRDLKEKKGRLDLMPLDVLSKLTGKEIPSIIRHYMSEGDTNYLYQAVTAFFIESKEWDSLESMILDVSMHYEMGLEKYPERNWEKGIPLSSYMDSALRHYFKYTRGDTDEPHHRAFIWNVINAIWTHQKFKYADRAMLRTIYNLPFSADWTYEKLSETWDKIQ